jgi:ABC-2 type transport system ATP-binding protein
VLWVRSFVRAFAAEGRTVLLSSHLMSEMAQTADHVIVLGRGSVIADAPIAELIAGGSGQRTVRVTSPESIRLGELLRAQGARSTQQSDGHELLLQGITAAQVGELAAAHGIVLHGLSTDTASLEDAYLELTRGELEYAAA